MVYGLGPGLGKTYTRNPHLIQSSPHPHLILTSSSPHPHLMLTTSSPFLSQELELTARDLKEQVTENLYLTSLKP